MQTNSRKYNIEVGSFYDKLDMLSSSLFEPHWEEVAKNKELMHISPDKIKYKVLEDNGALVSLFAYSNDKIVGYSVNIIQCHLHYSNLVCGYNDLLFVDKNFRNSPLGLRLIKETEKEMKKRGAKLMLWHAKEDTSLAKILPALKCKRHEIIFSKEL